MVNTNDSISASPKFYPIVPGFQIIRVLSKTRRSIVCLGSSPTGEEVIIKSGGVPVETECENLKELGPHPHFVSLIGWAVSTKGFCMVLEKVSGIPVIDILVDHGRMTERETRKILVQVAGALEFIHLNSMVHRDVKPDNIMYDRQTGRAKLIDFEFCSKTSQLGPGSIVKGTPLYMPPEAREMARQRRDTISQSQGPWFDVWSFGITLFVMVTAPFSISTRNRKRRRNK